jgi:protein MpaA
VLPVLLSVALLAGCTSVPTTAGAGRSTSPTLTQSPAVSPTSSAAPTPTSTAKPSPSPRTGVVVGPALRTGCLRTVTLGLSVQRRTITACERGAPGGVALVVIGTIHGDETLGLGVVGDLLKAPVQDGVDLWLIRTVNPDGLAHHTRGNARGVDENRNWPGSWAASTPGSPAYSGRRPLSEPETAALARFLTSLRPRTVVIFHSPLDAVDFSEGADPAVTRYLAQASGFVARSLGARPGSLTGWFNSQPWHGTAITFEFAGTTSTAQVARVSRALLSLARWRAGSRG